MAKENIKIVKFEPKYAKGISEVIVDCARKFFSNEATPEAIQEYIKRYNYDLDPDNFIERRSKIKIQFLAVNGDKVVGVIAGDLDHLGNLYVLDEFQRRGIASNLYKTFEQKAISLGSKKILIKSSIYAVSFYANQGFKKSTGVRHWKGHKIQPMKKFVKK